MTDLIDGRRASDYSSTAAKRRLVKRYRAEARFRAYGVLGLILTGAFLAVLFIDILGKGLPAFWQHSLMLRTPLVPAEIDPLGAHDPKQIARADFGKIVKDVLASRFPYVKSRAERKLLNSLLSSGAADALRDRVIANPALIGTTVATPALLSADADLFFKGRLTKVEAEPAKSAATLNIQPQERYEILSPDGAFAASLAEIKRHLGARIALLRAEAQGLLAQRPEIASRLAQARDGGNSAEVLRLENSLQSIDLKSAELQTRMQNLEIRASSSSPSEKLDATLPSILAAANGGLIKAEEISADRLIGPALVPPRSAASLAPGDWSIVTYQTPQSFRRIADQQIAWLEHLKGQGLIDRHFNTRFFTSGDSREPELAGIRGALVGSLLTLLVTIVLCLPVGVAAAIYLEEFAPKNRLTEIIEVNINNLAAVPSIVFGLLGLALFLNTFGLPRSAALVGGLVLALLVLPTIIIAGRASLRAVPPSIKDAALAVGASHQQAVFHHVLPLAMPGIMTGTIIGMAHALGETAPLLMIGMVAFIVDVPSGITDSATVLPVHIYLWSDLPEIAFEAKTAAAIIVLLAVLFVMNGTAIVLRRRFERRW
jgi:phosphate transport system permease protein